MLSMSDGIIDKKELFKKFPNGKLSVVISGLPASGKTTIAKLLSVKNHLDFYVGSDALRELAREQGYEPKGEDWWDSPEGMRFLSQREKDKSFDKKVDKKLIHRLEKGGVVMTSWTLPWLTDKAFMVWLRASKSVRAKRMAKRDKISHKSALRIVKERDEKNFRLYKDLYGFEYGKDLTPFDLIINTDFLNINELFKILDTVIKELKNAYKQHHR